MGVINMFLLQQGWGMLSLIEEFLSTHEHAGVILSPRVSERSQLENYLEEYKKLNALILFDPQFYEPRTNLGRILSYPYWSPSSFNTDTFDPVTFCQRVINYQLNTLKLDSIILPGRFTNSVDEQWREMQHNFAITGASEAGGKQVFSTVALGPDVILNSEAFDSIIDETINYPVNGVYLVFEHPENQFLIANEEFIYVILNGILSLALSGKQVILGYANQQLLVCFAAGLDYFATGNFRNVRAFDHINFATQENDTLKRSTWYFDGNSFGEYHIQKLSLAYRRGLRDHFGPATAHSAALLSAENLASIRWTEPEAFRHYLELMYLYCKAFNGIPKSERGQRVLDFFQEVKTQNDILIKERFSPGERGFNNVVAPTVDALTAYMSDRRSDISHS